MISSKWTSVLSQQVVVYRDIHVGRSSLTRDFWRYLPIENASNQFLCTSRVSDTAVWRCEIMFVAYFSVLKFLEHSGLSTYSYVGTSNTVVQVCGPI